MNGKKAKQIRKKARELVVDWLKTMLVKEESSKVSVDNIEKYLPEQPHVFANNKMIVSAYTPRWFTQRIKKLVNKKNIKDITWSDIENLG